MVSWQHNALSRKNNGSRVQLSISECSFCYDNQNISIFLRHAPCNFFHSIYNSFTLLYCININVNNFDYKLNILENKRAILSFIGKIFNPHCIARQIESVVPDANGRLFERSKNTKLWWLKTVQINLSTSSDDKPTKENFQLLR